MDKVPVLVASKNRGMCRADLRSFTAHFRYQFHLEVSSDAFRVAKEACVIAFDLFDDKETSEFKMVCLPDQFGICPVLAALADEAANKDVEEGRKWKRAEFSSLIEFHQMFPNECHFSPIISVDATVEFEGLTYTAMLHNGELMFFLAPNQPFGPGPNRLGPMFLYERPFAFHLYT